MVSAPNAHSFEKICKKQANIGRSATKLSKFLFKLKNWKSRVQLISQNSQDFFVNLTPEGKVWKVLKKVKKNRSTNWIVEVFTCENVRRQSKSWTLNYWYGRHGTYQLGYHINASWVTKWPFYSNHVMRGGMVE